MPHSEKRRNAPISHSTSLYIGSTEDVNSFFSNTAVQTQKTGQNNGLFTDFNGVSGVKARTYGEKS